jgi:hypothetical protein
LGFQLAVAHLLASALAPGRMPTWQALLGRVVCVVLLAGGIFSCVIYAGSRVWWNKGGVEYLEANLSAAELINQSDRPLVISDCNTWGLLVASHMLDPQVRLLVQPYCFACKVDVPRNLNPDMAKQAERFTDVFLYPAPSRELLARIERQCDCKLENIPRGKNQELLWQVKQQP